MSPVRTAVKPSAIPGGANTRSKQPGQLWPEGSGPHYCVGASGCEIQLDDGRWCVDMLCALGAVSVGYGYTPMPSSSRHVYSLPHRSEVAATDRVLQDVAPWASHVRMVRTGSEATHGALMVARRATSRQAYWRLRCSYHGWHECWQTEAEYAHWFDVGSVPSFTDPRPAAVIIEPPRWEDIEVGWLHSVVSSAWQAGALVIFDEMIYGGRWALGGGCEYYGVQPDLACFGKALGNGAPVAFIAGKQALAEHGTCVSGTYSGDSVALAELCLTLDRYRDEGVVGWMWSRGKQLRRGLDRAVRRTTLDVVREGAPVHQRLRFRSDEDGELAACFSLLMLERGVVWHPACANLMLAHTKDVIDRVVAAAEESLVELEGRQGGAG